MSLATLTALAGAALFGLLEGSDEAARQSAINALSGEAPATVAAVLDSVNWRGREAVVDALERHGAESLNALMTIARYHARKDARRLAVRALGRIGAPDGCDSIAVFLASDARALALGALSDAGPCDPDVIAPYLDDADHDVRRRALDAYARTGADDALERAVRKIDDAQHGVRFTAARILREGGDPAGALVLARCRELRGVGRILAVKILGDLKYDPASSSLRGLLGDDDWATRGAAVEALGRLGGTENLRAVREALERESHPFVRERLRGALGAEKARE